MKTKYKKQRGLDSELNQALELSCLPDGEKDIKINQRCSWCKKETDHQGTIVLNVVTGKWVHKGCENV